MRQRTRVREVVLLQLVLLNSETLVEDLRCLLTRDADVARDLLIAANAERSDSEASCGEGQKESRGK